MFFWAVFVAIFALRAKARAAQIATKHLQNFNAPVFELNQLSTSTITTEDELFDTVYEMYREEIIDGINSKITDIQENGPVTPIAPTATGGTLPTGDELYSEIESKMDSLNSFSQEKMIELQSETNKRDQAYDIITNVLKSLNNTQVGIANNI